MADITMCVWNGCPLGDKCYRRLAKPNPEWQSYADFSSRFVVVNVIGGATRQECAEFIPVYDKKAKTSQPDAS